MSEILTAITNLKCTKRTRDVNQFVVVFFNHWDFSIKTSHLCKAFLQRLVRLYSSTLCNMHHKNIKSPDKKKSTRCYQKTNSVRTGDTNKQCL